MRHGTENTERYKFGFQGQLLDDDIKGDGNSSNYKYRMNDPRLGRFFALDPLASQYSYNSPYAFSENRVIDGVELEGLEFFFSNDGVLLGRIGESGEIRVVAERNIELVQGYLLKLEVVEQKYGAYITKLAVGHSKVYHNADVQSIKNVASSIYTIWVKSTIPLLDMKYNDGDNGTAASTSSRTTGTFTVYPNCTEDGEFLMDNIYNQINVLFHEEQHNKDLKHGEKHNGKSVLDSQGDLIVYRHFEIHQFAIEHWSFKFTTEKYKEYSQGVMGGEGGYLDLEDSDLRDRLIIAYNDGLDVKAVFNSEAYQKDLNKNIAHINFYNKQFGTDRKAKDHLSIVLEMIKNAN